MTLTFKPETPIRKRVLAAAAVAITVQAIAIGARYLEQRLGLVPAKR